MDSFLRRVRSPSDPRSRAAWDALVVGVARELGEANYVPRGLAAEAAGARLGWGGEEPEQPGGGGAFSGSQSKRKRGAGAGEAVLEEAEAELLSGWWKARWKEHAEGEYAAAAAAEAERRDEE